MPKLAETQFVVDADGLYAAYKPVISVYSKRNV
jgi:hypothetical protein